MDFWRGGQARTYRDPAAPRKGLTLWQRITGFHVPPWAPVAFIIVIVFGILGLLFYTRSAAGKPRIGDHNHAVYTVVICGEKQSPIKVFEDSEGVHTHGDGIMHMHPFIPAGEGPGAAVRRFFEYGGGKLTDSELQVPGQKKSYKAGEDACNGQPAEVRVLRGDSGIHPLGGGTPGSSFSDAINKCNALPESSYQNVGPRYVPKDGECLRIIYGPPKVEPVIQQDRTIIDPSQATRTIDVQITGSEATTAFSPASINVSAGETVKVAVKNKSEPALGPNGSPTGEPFHGLRFAGPDGKYETSDDYVTEPPTLHPGEEGIAIIRFDSPGQFEFRDEAVQAVTGKVVVGEVASPTPTPEASATPEAVDVTLDVAMTDGGFEPANLTVKAGQKFRINLTNTGAFIHNLCSPGPDGICKTGDDLVPSTNVNAGETGSLVGKIDAPGTYAIRDNFNRTQITGVITIE